MTQEDRQAAITLAADGRRPVSTDRPDVSVVIATYNRPASLLRLLRQLERQTLAPHRFEIVVIDDGSTEPVADTVLPLVTHPITVLRTCRLGAPGARHHGLQRASSDTVVIVDDDVQIDEDFLAQHLALHPDGSRRAVLGRIRPDTTMAMPLFERFHAIMLERFAEDVRCGRLEVQGSHMATGNVSFRRADYFRVGGFDTSLRRSEDAELGIRLQKAGVDLMFSDAASVIHSSDHDSLSRWMRHALLYGACDLQISQKHPDLESADPWRYLTLVHPLSRPFLLACVIAPAPMHVVARLLIVLALALDRIGVQRIAMAASTLVFGIQYFCGVSTEAGSLRQTLRTYGRYRRLRGRARSTGGTGTAKLNRIEVVRNADGLR